MSDRLTNKELNDLKTYQSTLKASLTQLAFLERKNSASSRLRSPTRARIPTVSSPPVRISCATCGHQGHHYTECPSGSYVFDTPTVFRPLSPGESFPRPASWRDIHRASLQTVLRVTTQYYRRLHFSPTNLRTAHNIILQALGFPSLSPASLTPSDSSDHLCEARRLLLDDAITAVVARLSADPHSASLPGVFAAHSDLYYSPSLGLSIEDFRTRVLHRYSAPTPA